MSYVTHPFRITSEQLSRVPHTNPFECMEMVDLLLDRGYDVDVIDWTNTRFTPKKHYVAVFDVHQNLERLASLLPRECKKNFYITGAHWLTQNSAEYTRLIDLRERRGIVLPPRRNVSPSHNIEHADYAIALGNDFAKSTYAYAKKNIASIPLFSTVLFPSPEFKSFSRIAQHFVWIGGGGAVHKGLDRVLECFSQMPDYHLTVCGPVEGEKDFYEYYQKELTQTKNIEFVGRVNVRGDRFKKIVDNAIGLVYPSCSEGQSGSVITGLHAGLIPIVTRESGVDVEPFGITLQNASVEEIKAAVKTVAALPEGEMASRAVAAWTYAQKNHTRETFRNAYQAFLDTVFSEKI